MIGADGLHSRVRQLAFGADDGRELSLGYHVAAFEVDGYTPRDELVYVSHGVPGRQLSRFAMREGATMFLCVFRDAYMPAAEPGTDAERKAVLREVFAGMQWEWPRIREAMADAPEVYFDRVSQVRMGRWSRGRTALVGDAAACVSLLAGEGTGLAMAEAYVLGGELGACEGDHDAAFRRYEARMMPFLARKQAAAARFASSFGPATAREIAFRNLMSRALALPYVARLVLGRALRDDIELPAYRTPAA